MSTTFAANVLSPVNNKLQVNLATDVMVEFALEDDTLQGLSQLTIAGVPTIEQGSVRLPYFETRDNWALHSYRFQSASTSGSGQLTIDCDVLAIKSGMGRMTDAFHVPYITTPARQPTKIGRFRWHLTLERLTVGHPAVRTTQYAGVSYSYELDIDHDFHWILDSGTWEAGGSPAGITLLSPHLAPIGGPMEYTIPASGGAYTSAETFVKGSSNNADVIPEMRSDPAFGYVIPVQAQLRGAGGTVIDVQYNSELLLACFYPEPNYYRTLVEYRDGDIGIGHLDHHFFEQCRHYITPVKTIIGTRHHCASREQIFNLWTDLWDYAGSLWQSSAGIPRGEPVPGFGLDACGGAGIDYGSGPLDLFERWEERLDWMQENGFKTFFISSFLNHRGMELPMVANMCQPYDYTCLEQYGGAERFKLFCDRSHAHGIKVFTWVGIFLSTFAPVLKEHPEWFIRFDNGSIWDSNYQILQACSLRRGFGKWLLDQLTDLQQLGLDGIFIDSYHNLSAMPIDYSSPGLIPQFCDLIAWQSECERLGIETIVETFSPFGITSCGLWPQYLKPIELSYHTHYRSLVDDRVNNDFKNGTLDVATYFRMLANKAPIGLAVKEQANDPFIGLPQIPPEIAAMNAAYNALLPDMKVRTLNDDGTIEWFNPVNNCGALFTLKGTMTVPAGVTATGIFGTNETFTHGTHNVVDLSAFKLTWAL